MRHKLFVLMIVLAAYATWGAYVAAQDVPLDLQAKLMLKILSMDRNLDRCGDPIKIGSSDDSFIKELNAIRDLTIKGKAFAAEKMGGIDDIAKYKVVYIGKNWSANYSAAAAQSVKNSCLMFCQTEDGVLSGGGAVSFKVVDDKPKIVVNLENAKNQGTDFPANFLTITMVVGSLQ